MKKKKNTFKDYSRLSICTIAVKGLLEEPEKKILENKTWLHSLCTINFLEPGIFKTATTISMISNAN